MTFTNLLLKTNTNKKLRLDPLATKTTTHSARVDSIDPWLRSTRL